MRAQHQAALRDVGAALRALVEALETFHRACSVHEVDDPSLPEMAASMQRAVDDVSDVAYAVLGRAAGHRTRAASGRIRHPISGQA